MVKQHLKRLATPKTWKIQKKGLTFITRPKPGAHSQRLSLSLSTIMKIMIKCAKTTREVKKMLLASEITVDGKRVKDHRLPVGLMDVISLKPTKENYRIIFNKKGNLSTISIDDKEAKSKLSQINGKTILKGGKVQLNLSDSRNIIVEKDEYKVGDSIMFEVPSQKITGNFKLDKGAAILLIAGKHIADIGTVEKVGSYAVIYKNDKGEAKTTASKYAFVVGKDKPALKIQ